MEPIEGHYRRKALRASVAPSEAERDALVDRFRELSGALGQADPTEVKRSIATLRSVLPAAPGTELSAQLAIAAFVSVLTPFPMWAINQVCRKYLDGSLSSGGFAPSPPEMANQCRAAVARFQAEQANIDAILSAEIYDDPTPASIGRATEAEAAIAEAARSRAVDYWHNTVRPGFQPKTAGPKEHPEDTLKRLEAQNAASPVVVGGELRAKLDAMADRP